MMLVPWSCWTWVHIWMCFVVWGKFAYLYLPQGLQEGAFLKWKLVINVGVASRNEGWKNRKGVLREQAKQSIFNFIVLWEAMLIFELNDLKHISEEVNSEIVTGHGISAVKLTFEDYSFLGIDDMSVGMCMPLLWEPEIRKKKLKLIFHELTFQEDVWWNGTVVPSTLNFEAGGRCEWLGSCLSCCVSEESTPIIRFLWRWVNPRDDG